MKSSASLLGLAVILLCLGVFIGFRQYLVTGQPSGQPGTLKSPPSEGRPTWKRYLGAVIKLERYQFRALERHPKRLELVRLIEELGIRLEGEGRLTGVTSDFSGSVTQVLLQPGDRVEEGQRILEIERWNVPRGESLEAPLRKVQFAQHEGFVGQLFHRSGGFVEKGARLFDLVRSDESMANR